MLMILTEEAEQVDIYSMAMIFWYIYTGVRPFDNIGPDLIAELTSIRGARPPAAAVGPAAASGSAPAGVTGPGPPSHRVRLLLVST